MLGVQVLLCQQELLIKESCVDFHGAGVKADRLTAFEMQTSVQVGHDSAWRHNIRSLVDLFVSSARLIQFSVGIVLLCVDARHEVVLPTPAEVLKRFVVAVAACRAMNILDLVVASCVVLQCVQNSLDLQCGIEPEFGAELRFPIPLAHLPVVVLG